MSDPSKANPVSCKLPLSGINIADFSWGVVGPYTTMCLSLFGAEVIKVESIHAPEVIRVSAPFKDNVVGLNRSFHFARMNTNKYSISLNLNHPKGQELARRIVAWADVLVESFVSGSLEKRGLGYDVLKQVNPKLIMLSTTSQGKTGPYSKHPGWGYQLVALGGFTHLTGWPDREPSAPVGAYTDLIAPWFAATAILGALDFRDRTGLGQQIDLSQLETGLATLAPAFLDYTVNRRIQKRMGNRSLFAAPHGIYRCLGEDRWCAISITTDKEWKAFCTALGNPAWTKENKFTTLLGRKKHEDELDTFIEKWTMQFTAEEVMARLQAMEIPAGVVKNSEDVYRDPQLRYRGHYRVVEHPEIGRYSCELPAMRLPKCQMEIRRPAPCLGEHTEYVCCEILGMNTEEFVELMSEGALE